MMVLIGSTLARLRLNRKDIDSKYLFWYLESKNSYIKSQRTGATIPHVNGETLKQIQIPLPPLSIQKEIAEILDTADALRKKDNELLKKYDELAQSVFIEMFGDPVRNEKGWEEVKLLEIIETGKNKIRTGPFGSDLLHSEFVESGITVLGIDNIVNNTFEANKGRFITEEKFTKLARYQVYPQDVLITIMGTIGRSAVVPNDIGRAINTKHIVAMTVNKEIINPHFLSFTLTKNVYVIEQMKKKSRGAIMDGLNSTLIKDLNLRLPPIDLQNKFEESINNLMKQKELIAITHTNNLFYSLLQKAFKGELT